MPSAQRGSAPSAGPHAASGSGASSAARLEERIRGMESRRESFLQPVADAADFDAWSEHFELRGEAGDVETLLEQREALRAMHARLVPDELSEESFWRRYFYARQALEAQEARRLELLRRRWLGRPLVVKPRFPLCQRHNQGERRSPTRRC